MAEQRQMEPITVRTDRAAEIDALATATNRSRDDVVNQAIEQYLDANAWQVARIEEGLAAARDGQIVPADDVFATIAAKHGWSR